MNFSTSPSFPGHLSRRTLNTLSNRPRSKKGSILALAVIILAFVLVPAGIILNKYFLLLNTQARYQNSVEAASLLVAEQIGRIVVNDPHFGFVSLTNQPPIGRATLAADEEPCPVTSINNLLATIRLDTLIAHELNDDNMSALANADYEQSKSAELLLQSSLLSAIDPMNKTKFTDMDGNPVDPYKDAQNLLEKNLQANNGGHPVTIRNLHISLGWLRQGGMTNTPLPEPIELAELHGRSHSQGKYEAGIDIPAFGQSFFFAPVAKAPALADEAMFVGPDGKRFCSVVKLEADVQANSPFENLFDLHPKLENWLHIAACAVPGESAQVGPTGALLVFFPCGPISELKSLAELLRLPDNNDQPTQFYQAVNGDLPVDPDASTAPTHLAPWGQQDINCHRVVASGLYSWLRSAGVRPRVDSTLAALRQEFSNSLKNSNLLYEFDPHGRVVISSLPAMPLPISVLSDQQPFVETHGDDYSISCYNNVYNLGTINGGKHAGQPLAGDPINWCDLPYFGLSADSACTQGKGVATGLSAINQKQVISPIPGAVLREAAEFEVRGNAVAAKPRKSYYSGGLAVELTISAI